MRELNSHQKQAVEYTKGPLIIVAGAGTGKTTVITNKVAYLIEKKLALPEEILVLAFNDKAAEEIVARVDEKLDLGYVELQISTFHAFCQKILEQYGLEIGLSNQFKILTQTDAWILIRQNLDKFNLDYYRPLGNPTRHIHELIKHFSKCKDELITPQEYLDYAENLELDKDDNNTEDKSRITEIANAFHTYNQLLLDNNALDFGDLIQYAVILLEKRKNVSKQLQNRFKYILVDEFQDVNWAQYQLVRFLVNNQSQLTVVGDDDQSIYAFRGASVSNIMRFKDDFLKAKEIVLTENYRSGQKILDTAYQSIQNNNPDRLEAKLKIDKKLKSALKINSEVIYIHKTTLDDETRAVVEEIGRLKIINKETTWDDFAILVRANSHAQPFINILEAKGISYEFLASSGLYRQPIVLDCLNFFKLLNSYHESTAIYRLLRLPFLNFKENDLQKITYNAKRKSISYYETIKRATEFNLSPDGLKICDKLIGLIHDGLKNARFNKPHRVLYEFLEQSGYLKYLAHEENKNNREVTRQIYQLTQFFNYLKKYEETTPDAHITDFMIHYNDLAESGDEGNLYQPVDTPDSVNIITVHKAKGLEFKYVFVVNLVEDRFPARKRGEGIEMPAPLIKEQLPEGDSRLQEERRLFYVALTRAKEKLYLTSASDYGGVKTKKISRFLDELGYKIINSLPEKTNEILINQKNKNSNNDNNKEGLEYSVPTNFSFSQIKSYNTCPYQYKLGNIIKLPIKETHYFSFGNTMHNTLQEFYKRIQILNSARQNSLFDSVGTSREMSPSNNINIPDLKELLSIYEEKWLDEWYLNKQQREKYFADGKKMLTEFYNSQKNSWTIPIVLEGGFKIKIKNYLINGRIDRIDKLEKGTLHIIDYKTGASKETAVGDEKDQLLLYQLAVSSLPQYTNIGLPEKLTLYYLKDNLQTNFIGKDKEIEKLQNKIATTIDKIQAKDFMPTPEKFTCKNCHFKDICESRM